MQSDGLAIVLHLDDLWQQLIRWRKHNTAVLQSLPFVRAVTLGWIFPPVDLLVVVFLIIWVSTFFFLDNL